MPTSSQEFEKQDAIPLVAIGLERTKRDLRWAVRPAFDDLRQFGLETFTMEHEPCWNTPLNETLTEPATDLPTPEPQAIREEGPTYRPGSLFAPPSARERVTTHRRTRQ